jgi:ankyrin repeat protein
MKNATKHVPLHKWKTMWSTYDDQDLLMHASQSADIHTASRLLLANVDVTEGDKDGLTPLHVATSPAMVDLLLAHNANLEERACGGWTCLMTASRDGLTSVVGALLAHGASVNAVNTQSYTALMLATRNNDLETMKLLLQNQADDSKTLFTMAFPSTSLQVAIRFGSMSARSLLIANGAKTSSIITHGVGFTELMIAAEKGDTATVNMLIQAGAPVPQLIGIESALTLATRNGHYETVIALLAHDDATPYTIGCGKNVLMLAVDSGSLKTVDAILLHGYGRPNEKIPITGEAPYSVLDWALCNNATAVALLLLAYDTDGAEDHSYDVDANSQGQQLMKRGVELNGEISEWKLAEQRRQVACEFDAVRTKQSVVSTRIRRAMREKQVCDDGWMFRANGVAMKISGFNGPCQTFDEFVPCYRVGLLDQLCVLHPDIFMSPQTNPPVLANVGVNRPYTIPRKGTPPLICAAQDGNTDEVNSLLDNIKSQTAMCAIVNAAGLSALHVASTPEMAQLLVNRGFPVDNQVPMSGYCIPSDNWLVTPLMTATRDGRIAVVATLLKNNADLTLVPSGTHSAMSWALQNNRLNVANLLVAHARSLKDPHTADWLRKHALSGENKGRRTCLMHAVRSGSTKAVRWLLDKGAVLDAATYVDETALTIACSTGNTAIVALLLKQGAREVGRSCGMSSTALQQASQRGFVAIVAMLLEYDPWTHKQSIHLDTALMVAASDGETAVVRLLLEKGAGERVAVEKMTVRRHKWVRIVQMDIQNQSDKVNVILALDLPNKDGKTALMLAAQKGYHAIVALLLTYNADVNIAINLPARRIGVTALSYAVLGGHLKTVNMLLLEGRASIETSVDLMGTPLVQSALTLNTTAARATATLLIAYGAEVSTALPQGETQQHAVNKGVMLRDKASPWYQKERHAILQSRLPPNAPQALVSLTMEYETVDMLAVWRLWEQRLL